MERIGFRVSENASKLIREKGDEYQEGIVSENPTELIWERSEEYGEDIVTACLILLAGSYKVYKCIHK